MADRRDNQFDERWRDNPYRTKEWDERNEDERHHYGQWNQGPAESAVERNRSNPRSEPEWSRSERERGPQQWSQRSDFGPSYEQRPQRQAPPDRTTQYRDQFRDRPSTSTSSYAGQGGYSGHSDPYREDDDRGHGETDSGVNWGAGDIGRHRPGSLTDSAAASAVRVSRERAQREGGRFEGDYQPRNSHAGRGPKGFVRSDERIREDICERLTHSHDVDATDIEVAVNQGGVTLSGSVEDRRSKRVAEDIAQDVWGAKDVQNHIRMREFSQAGTTAPAAGAQTSAAAGTANAGNSVLGLNAEPAKR